MSKNTPDHENNKKKLIIDLVLLVIMAVLLFVVLMNRKDLFLGQTYEFKTAAAAFYGADGRKYVIDEGKTGISMITADNVISRRLKGGDITRFYYAQGIAEGSLDGKSVLYISDIAYREEDDGTVEENRVVEYCRGKYKEVYNAGSDRIYEIKVRDNELYILKAEDTGMALIKLHEDGSQEFIQREYCGDILNGASADLTTGCIAIATRRGSVRIINKGAGEWETPDFDEDHLMPGAVSAENGRVFYSDYYGGRVCCFEEDDTTKQKTVLTQEDLKISFINVSSDGNRAICCDYISFCELTLKDDGGSLCEFAEKLDYAGFYKTVLLWLAVFASALILLRLLRFVPHLVFKLMRNESALRMASVVIAVVSVSCFIAWTLISDQHANEDEWDISNMKLFTDLVLNNIDVDLLKHIQSETDYAGSSYIKLRDRLDLLMYEASEEGRDYYYVFYSVKDGKLNYLLNYYDSVMCTEPFGRMDDTYYQMVYKDRNSYALKSRDADGLWLYVLTPVEDGMGNCVAILEIGTDLSYRTAERREQTIDIALSVFCSSAVMVMLIIEGLMLIGFFERKAVAVQQGSGDVTKLIPLRGIILFSYAACTLQDSFITVLASKLYDGSIPFLPERIAAGLPLTLNLLMMAVFAAVGGHLEEKLGTKKVLLAGVFIEMSGFVICVITGSYPGLLIGNTLAGTGLGLINVVCNTIAAMGEGTEGTAAAFADVMAGILSGLTIGAGLASLFYPIGGSRLSYSVAAVFMAPVFFLVTGCINVKGEETGGSQEETSRIGFKDFFFSPSVLGYMFLILVPFMTSVSYREYFYPVFAVENGIPEARTAQLYMICGLLVIYVGPHISGYIINRFGTYKGVIIASLAMGANMLMFVLFPGMVTAVSGMVLLSTITSFAYTCQYTFFEELPESQKYGDGKSMGVYSVFENLGQTIGPTVYGIVLTLGYRNGIALFCVIMVLLTLWYVVLMRNVQRKAENAR